MAYNKEKASKINYLHLIQNDTIRKYLSRCDRKKFPLQEDIHKCNIPINNIKNKHKVPLEYIIAVDGGYQEVCIDENFPSSKLCYYNIGIVNTKIKELESLEKDKIINPNLINKIEENSQIFGFVIPMQNICLQEQDFTDTVRKTIFEIFANNALSLEKLFKNHKDKPLESRQSTEKDSFINTIKWLVFKEYENSDSFIEFACPQCKAMQRFTKQTQNYTDEKNDFIVCNKCGEAIYITDCFDLHTLVDEINGATLIQSYIMSVFEIVLMLSMFRFFFENNALYWLERILFIKDGPLALFSRLDDFVFKIVRPFLQFLYEKSLQDGKSYTNIVGLDKSGMFVEHFLHIESKISENSLILPNLDYMRKYITGNNASVFGENTYFGIKIFVKKDDNLSFLLDLAVPFSRNIQYKDYIKNPSIEDFLALKAILEVLCKLKCDLYAKSFIPIAMINKLVSLSNVPSKKILTLFSQDVLR
ncbi:DNA double-strand break repair nuclease NurA [uncultured Helicobacter sp.]|uniref:DNA double-strand break repair nuclease NurA n=1 Tax=uncultured Helicobacter sp. TaxID=175537 RepID=UPI00374F7505